MNPSESALGRQLGLRLGISWAVFEILLALAGGASRLPGLHATALFVTIPLALYGGLGWIFGAFLLRKPRLRTIAPFLFVAFGVAQFVRMDGISKGLAAFDDPWLVVIAFLALGGLLWLRLATRLLFGAWALSVPVAVGLSMLWASEKTVIRYAHAPQTAAVGPNIVLISWDTVRADLLPIYGGTGLALPNLEALAARSVVFDQAIAVAPITGPSHATMLTGLYPVSHGLRSNGTTKLSARVPTLVERLSEHGYHTAGFVSAYPLSARFGFFRGFQVYDDRLPNGFSSRIQDFGPKSFLWLLAVWKILGGRDEARVTGDVINARALEWVRQTSDPYFLFLHYFDAHWPYTPTEPYEARALASEAEATPRAVNIESGQEMITLYRAEIAWLDDLLGEVIAALETKDPQLENTLIILTSDHGECFGEGGIVGGHMASLYDATQHVPLMIHLPGGAHAGKRVSTQVSHLDLAPTLLKFLSLPIPGEATGPLPEEVPPMQGLPLLDLIENSAGLEREWIYLEAFQDRLRGRRKQGLRSPDWKFIRWLSEKRKLFRLNGSQPASGEFQDLAQSDQVKAYELENKMWDLVRSLPKAVDSEYEWTLADQSALSELGYLEHGSVVDEKEGD